MALKAEAIEELLEGWEYQHNGTTVLLAHLLHEVCALHQTLLAFMLQEDEEREEAPLAPPKARSRAAKPTPAP